MLQRLLLHPFAQILTVNYTLGYKLVGIEPGLTDCLSDIEEKHVM